MAKPWAIIRDFSGGVRLDKDPRDLEPDELAWSLNMYQPKLGGNLASRLLVGTSDSIITYSWAGYFAPKVDTWRDAGGRWWTLFAARTADGQLTILNYRVGSVIYSNQLAKAVSTERPSTITWNGKIYYFDGTGIPGVYFEANADGTAITAVGLQSIWPSSDLIFPTVVWVHRRQFVFAGFTGTSGGLIRNSEIEDPHTLVTVAKSFSVGREETDRIVGGAEIAVEGGAEYFESYSLIWKTNSTWMLQGDLPTATGSGSVKLTRILNEGCVSKDTIVKTKYGTVWCSGVNVWIAPIGGRPISIGDAIVPRLALMSRKAVGAWTAGLQDGFYMLSIPSNMAEDGVAQLEQWWCDLRQFPEKVSWWGPMLCGAQLALVQDSESSDQLVTVGTFRLSGGQVHISRLVAGNVASQHIDPDRANAGLPALPHEIRTKEFDGGEAGLQKIVQSLYVSAHATGPISVDAVLLGEGGTVKASPTASTTGSDGFVLGTSLLGTGLLGSGYSKLVYYPPNGNRFIADTVQVVIKQTPASASAGRPFQIRELGLNMRVIARRPSK